MMDLQSLAREAASLLHWLLPIRVAKGKVTVDGIIEPTFRTSRANYWP